MDLTPTELQTELSGSFGAAFAKLVTSERVRGADPVGFDHALWQELCGLGCLEMTLPGAAESPSGLWEASIVAGLAGRHAAPVPLGEAIACLRLLHDGNRAATAAEDLQAGRIVVGAAGAPVDAGPQVLASGAVADLVLAPRGADAVALLGRPEPAPEHASNLGSMPVAVDDLARWADEGDALRGAGAGVRWARLQSEQRLLAAAGLVETAAAALEVAAEHARTRHQFGVPIGTFQGVSHRLADVATAVDAARLVVGKATWAGDLGRDDAGNLREMAWVQATRAAEDATGAAVHVLGGYGITTEHDIQLLFRHAKAVSLLGGGRRAGLARLAGAVLP